MGLTKTKTRKKKTHSPTTIFCTTTVGSTIHTLTVCLPAAGLPAPNVVTTGTILFATNPSSPPHAAGSCPGTAFGMNCVVCGGCASSWIAILSGRSVEYAFSEGESRVVMLEIGLKV